MEGEVLVGGSTLCCEMATHLEHLKCPIVFFRIMVFHFECKKTCEIVMKGHEGPCFFF